MSFSSENPFHNSANPYSPPSAPVAFALPDGGPGPGLWRDRNVLVMQRGVMLPAICVMSNEPATQTLSRKLQYLNPWFVLLALVSLPIFAIVALIATKRETIVIGLTDEWIDKRLTRMKLAWAFGLTGFAAIVFGVLQLQPDFQLTDDNDTQGMLVGIAIAVGAIVGLTGLLIGNYGCRLIHAQKIDDKCLRIKGVNPAFLDRLPVWPGK